MQAMAGSSKAMEAANASMDISSINSMIKTFTKESMKAEIKGE